MGGSCTWKICGGQMIVWHSPWAFLFLVLIVGLWVRRWLSPKEQRPVFQYSSLRLISGNEHRQKRGLKVYLLPVIDIIKTIAFVLAIIALARPQKADEITKKNIDGIDIMIALDISDSMIIEDMPPLNRVECAKENIKQFIKGRTTDRIGLVLFMGEAFTKVPLTMDYNLLLDAVKDVQPLRTIKMGTAIGVALANAVNRLKDSKAKSKVIIFLTDGENNSGTIDPETALEIAKGYGIRIYTIGIGKDGETRLPIITTDPFGNKVKRYIPFYDTVNTELLTMMAHDTGGKYWRVQSANAMEEVFKDIDTLEKTKVEINKYTKYTELFPPWLLASFIFFILSFMLERIYLRRFP